MRLKSLSNWNRVGEFDSNALHADVASRISIGFGDASFTVSLQSLFNARLLARSFVRPFARSLAVVISKTTDG